MSKYNGTDLKGMIYNGQEVNSWVHNGVEVFSASEPWVAYLSDGTTLKANSPATTPQYTGNYLLTTNPEQYMYICGGTGALSIKTKNIDGTNFLPTNGCKYMDVIVRANYDHEQTCVVTGMKNGTETVILTYTIPRTPNNTKNVVDGATVIEYVHNLTNIDVSGYDSIKVESYCNASYSNGHSVGLGRLIFHN